MAQCGNVKPAYRMSNMSEGSQVFAKFAASLADSAREDGRSLARWLGIESMMMMMIRLGGAGILLIKCALQVRMVGRGWTGQESCL